MMSLLQADAVPARMGYFVASPDDTYRDVISVVISELSCADMKSIFFLLMSEVGYSAYLHLIRTSQEKMRLHLYDLLLKSCKQNFFLLELLGTMKKYNLLKKIGLCKHRYFQCKKELTAVPNVWKKLYAICEALDVNEVKKLCLLQDYSITSAEELLCTLFLHGKIRESDLTVLEEVLDAIGRPELVERLNENSNKRRTYEIRMPTSWNFSGLAVVINQESFVKGHSSGNSLGYNDRPGSSIDRDKLCKLWKGFGLKTDVHNNLEAKPVYDVFEDIASSTENWDLFVACILSHGEEGVIYGSDLERIKINDLVKIVANHCHGLNGKPKLFFIQACQGHKKQQGAASSAGVLNIQTDAVKEKTNEKIPICSITPEYTDVFIAEATIPGYVSYRHPERGSLFVSSLVDKLKIHGCNEDIHSVMRRVAQEISVKQPVLQTPVITSTLRSDLVFRQVVL